MSDEMSVSRRNKILMAVANGKPSDGICETEEELKLYMRTQIERDGWMSRSEGGAIFDVVNDVD